MCGVASSGKERKKGGGKEWGADTVIIYIYVLCVLHVCVTVCDCVRACVWLAHLLT